MWSIAFDILPSVQQNVPSVQQVFNKMFQVFSSTKPPLEVSFAQSFKQAMEKEMSMEVEMDFISELPDAVLHHILSFIDMIFVVRTSILSKRWRYLWRSTYFLNFNEELFNSTTDHLITTSEAAESNSNNGNKDHFIDFVNKVVFLHCKSNINSFSICGVDPRQLSSSLTWTPIWRSDAENRRTLDLSMCFFNSNTLTTLKLDMGSKKGRQIFKIPDLVSVDLPCLKTLHLGSVLLVDGDSISGFFSKCLGLETLIISSCLLEERNNLSINGLQLNYLELGISCVKNTCIGDNNGKITVFAPKLKFFKSRDLLLSEFYFDLGNVFALGDADIDACLASNPVCLCRTSSNYSPHRKEEFNQNVLKCLRNVCSVKSLSLCMCLLKDKLQGLLNPFCNLRILQLKTLFLFHEHTVIIGVLEMCPYLQTLILERNLGPFGRPLDKIFSKGGYKVGELWEVKAPSQCVSHYLQFIEIRGVCGTLSELKLLRFLMKNAVMLVKLTLVTSDVYQSQSYFEGCLRTFLRKLAALPKASSSVEISVVPQH